MLGAQELVTVEELHDVGGDPELTPLHGRWHWVTSLAIDFSGAFDNLPGARLDPWPH